MPQTVAIRACLQPGLTLAVVGLSPKPHRDSYQIDVVNCFRNADDIPPIAQEAVAIGAKGLWMQLGIVNEAAAQTARDAGLHVVQDRCIKVEHARMHG